VLSFHKSSKPGEIGAQIEKDEQFCIYCGACENVCPTKSIDVKRTAVKHTPTKSKSWQKSLESLKT
jgi:4Fe-4S ferredoxin